MPTHDFHLAALARAHRTDLLLDADRSRLAAAARAARSRPTRPPSTPAVPRTPDRPTRREPAAAGRHRVGAGTAA